MTDDIRPIHSFISALFSIFLLFCPGAAFSNEQLSEHDSGKGLIPEDYFDFVYVSDPQISPQNDTVLFVKRTIKEDASGRNSQVFKIDKDGVVSEFTQGKGDRSPKWSADGSEVAFIRSVDKKSQVFIMPADGGEAKQVTSLDKSLSSFAWFPDGDKLLLVLNISPEDDASGKDDNAKKDAGKEDVGEDKTERAKPDIVVVKNARYIANGSRYLSDKRKHLFVFDIETKELTQLTSGDDWNVNGPLLSNDGESVYFHANRTGLEYEGNANSDVFRLDISTKKITAITHHGHSQYSASLSPDNSKLVFLHREDNYEQADLLLMNEDNADTSKETKNLTANFDRNATSPVWAPDNENLYFITNDQGANRLFSVSVKTGEVTPLLEKNKTLRNLTISKDGNRLVFSMESSTELPELYQWHISTDKLTKLTQFNDELMSKKQFSPAEDLWFINEKDMKVQGFVHKPLNFDENKSWPLVLNIKGGPGGMWGHQWFHENQMYVAKGYAVAYVNYRGSSGYGTLHSKAVRQDYGGADYQDNMQFLDKVLVENKWIDKERLYITGGSHGGFLTNWITTQTDRFKAAVTQRSVSSWVSEAGTQQFTPAQMTREFGGNLWDNFDAYWDRSPLKYANKVSTPTLIIHSDADMITPIGQGQEWFYALKANEVPVEMVIFKGQTHSLSRTGTPAALVERLDRILEWFERYP